MMPWKLLFLPASLLGFVLLFALVVVARRRSDATRSLGCMVVAAAMPAGAVLIWNLGWWTLAPYGGTMAVVLWSLALLPLALWLIGEPRWRTWIVWMTLATACGYGGWALTAFMLHAAGPTETTKIRRLGNALFEWLADEVDAAEASEGKIPETADRAEGEAEKTSETQWVSVDDYRLVSQEEVEELLVPQYLDSIDWRGFWGDDYEVRLNYQEREHLFSQHVFMIRSSGSDRQFSGDRYEVGPFDPDDHAQDIVWADGFFVRWAQRVPQDPE